VFPSVASTKNRIKSSNILSAAEDRLGDGETEDDGLAEPDGEGDALAEADLEPDGESEAEPDELALTEGLALPLGDGERLGESDAEDEWLNPNKPSSLRAWPQERVSTTFLISIPLANLLAPLIPRSANGLVPPSQNLFSYVGIILS